MRQYLARKHREMIQLRIFALSTCVLVTTASSTVPVFLLDEGLLNGVIKSELDPFQEVKQEAFETLMQEVRQISRTTIFFIEERLTLQDIMIRDNKGTSFPLLRKEFVNKKLKMFLQVEDPYSYIKSRYPSFGFNEFYLKSTVSKLRFDESYRHMYIFFEDDKNETRIQLLRRHDAILQQVYFAIKQLSKGPVIAVYTAKRGSEDGYSHDWPLSDEKPNNRIEFNCDGANFEFYGTTLRKGEILPPLKPDICDLIKLDRNRFAYNLHLNLISSGLTHTYKVQFIFKHFDSNDISRGWRAVEVNYAYGKGNDLQETQMLDFTGNWSTEYVSTTPLVMIPNGESTHPTLTINKYVVLLKKPRFSSQGSTESQDRGGKGREFRGPKYQRGRLLYGPGGDKGFAKQFQRTDPSAEPSLGPITEPPAQTTAPETPTADDEGLILATPAILMSILVVLLLVGALFWGIDMLMNVHTNSRYDSPDSKPLFDPETVKD